MTPLHPFRFGVVAAQARSSDEWLAKARRAENLGFSTFLIPDTLNQTLAPLAALAALATATTSLRLGTYVLANDYRNPVLVARESATIDFLSGGRFELGLGAGRPSAEDDYRKLGMPLASGGVRVERLTESLAIIKTLLCGKQASASGSQYAVVDADIFPRPIQQPHLPILIAAAGKRLLSLAAREADIIALALPPNTAPETVAETVNALKAAAGERFDQLELNYNLTAAGQHVPAWVKARLNLDVAELARLGSISVLMGTTDEMCTQLLERRERFGISYMCASEDAMEALAPVIERLAGQ